MKFYGGVWDGKRSKLLNFSGDLNHDPAFVEIYAHFTLQL